MLLVLVCDRGKYFFGCLLWIFGSETGGLCSLFLPFIFVAGWSSGGAFSCWVSFSELATCVLLSLRFVTGCWSIASGISSNLSSSEGTRIESVVASLIGCVGSSGLRSIVALVVLISCRFLRSDLPSVSTMYDLGDNFSLHIPSLHLALRFSTSLTHTGCPYVKLW